jgi:hypothetical protein
MSENDIQKQTQQQSEYKFVPREPTAEEKEIYREVARMIHGK